MKTSIPSSHEHPFAQYVRILGKGKKGSRSLTEQEAYDAMTMIMQGQTEDVQLGAFLMLLRVKEESSEELLGFVRAVREFIETPSWLEKPDLDWSSYAGKRRHLPWYLLAVLLLSQNNVRIFMHGACGHTIDRIYTEDVLTQLGFKIAHTWTDVRDHLQQQQFAYMPLSELCPPLHQMIELRNTLGLRSPVHTLSRLLNPLDCPFLLQSIFHPGYRPVHQEAAQALGYPDALVIKGEAGEIERNPDAQCLLQGIRAGVLYEETWPALFNRRHIKEDKLDINTLVNTWRGNLQHEYGQASVISTAAIALYLLGRATNEADAHTQAKVLWAERTKGLM